MSKIDLTIHKEGLAHNIQKAKENNIICLLYTSPSPRDTR